MKREISLCDVAGCTRRVLLGWRPLTERRGRQICEYHWLRHKDETDSFDLFDEFKFRRALGIWKPVLKKHIPRCTCGRALDAGHRFCAICAKERERLRKKRAYHERKHAEPKPIVRDDTPRCRACREPRKPGHTYCDKCAEKRKKQSNRERRRRSYRKTVKYGGLV